MASLNISPSWIPGNGNTTTVKFIGIGTSWTTSAPTFAHSGLAGVSIGSVTVVSDLLATAPVTGGTTHGNVTWTDSTTSATATQYIGLRRPYYVPPRPRHRPR